MLYQMKKKFNNNFTIVNNQIIENKNLSWKAKGILIYLISRPDDWQVYIKDLINRACDGEKALRSGLKELEENGYLNKKIERDSKGRFVKTIYYIYDTPEENKNFYPIYQNRKVDKNTIKQPFSQKRNVEKRNTEKEVHNNTNINNMNHTKKKKEEKKENLPENFNEFLNWLKEQRISFIKDIYFWEKKIKNNFLKKEQKTIENYKDFIKSKEKIEKIKKIDNSIKNLKEKYLNKNFIKEKNNKITEYKIINIGIAKEIEKLKKDKNAQYYINGYDFSNSKNMIFAFENLNSIKIFLKEKTKFIKINEN